MKIKHMSEHLKRRVFGSLPSETIPIKHIYQGQLSPKSTFIDESEGLDYILNNEAYKDELNGDAAHDMQESRKAVKWE